MTSGLDDDLALALRLADAADALTMAAFTGEAVEHEIKPDGSPVSAADLAVERRIAEILAEERPADGVLGEEVGESGPAGRRWIVDGIDGTVLFVAGRSGWGTEIALEVEGEVVVGVCTVPAGAQAAGGGGGRPRAPGPGTPATPPGRAASGAGSRPPPDWPAAATTPSPRWTSSTAGAGSWSSGWPPPAAPTSAQRARRAAGGRRAGRRLVQLGGGPWDFAALAVIVTEAGGGSATWPGARTSTAAGPCCSPTERTPPLARATRYNGPMSERPLSAIVLAAGQGTRMRSARPKPLHRLCGRPLVRYVLDAVAGCRADRAVVVVGYGADRVIKALQQDPGPVPLEFVEQRVQRGTGDAVAVGLTGLPDDLDADGEDGDVVVLPGDTPLIRPETLAALSSSTGCRVRPAPCSPPAWSTPPATAAWSGTRRAGSAASSSTVTPTPTSWPSTRSTPASTCSAGGLLARPAPDHPDNSQGELYVTDVVEVLAVGRAPVVSLVVDDPDETQGVNDRAQLAVAEAELRRRTNQRWMEAGVTIVDPAATYVDATVTLAPDVTLFPGTVLRGSTTVGAGSEIGPATRLTDTRVGERATVTESVATHAEVGDDAVVGPFAGARTGVRVGRAR